MRKKLLTRPVKNSEISYPFSLTFPRVIFSTEPRAIVRAAFDGYILEQKYVTSDLNRRKDLGSYLILYNSERNQKAVYGYLSEFIYEPGQVVMKETPIAMAGETGDAIGPSVYFELRYLNDEGLIEPEFYETR